MGDRPDLPLLLYGTSSPHASSSVNASVAASRQPKIGCDADVYRTPHSCQRASPSSAGRIVRRNHGRSYQRPGRHLYSPSLRLFPPP
ncbi:hypothetical protein L873DRAFT_1675471 [Choiromyces venosus 120613-1]|uniref:Uncharacterized protein n=1 Tax=Choiromyces venosus 120613-1 TaxID=1336337 RepID=A0A3N4JWW9_9PEZI|nr:hypothetical protein L873DRAFT_1675471 [Choiromyces venosus 120613-1]